MQSWQTRRRTISSQQTHSTCLNGFGHYIELFTVYIADAKLANNKNNKFLINIQYTYLNGSGHYLELFTAITLNCSQICL